MHGVKVKFSLHQCSLGWGIILLSQLSQRTRITAWIQALQTQSKCLELEKGALAFIVSGVRLEPMNCFEILQNYFSLKPSLGNQAMENFQMLLLTLSSDHVDKAINKKVSMLNHRHRDMFLLVDTTACEPLRILTSKAQWTNASGQITKSDLARHLYAFNLYAAAHMFGKLVI